MREITAAEDLAPYLRDWRMEKCEHYSADICSPCLRDRILAWFATRQPAPTVSAETMGALDELCRLDDEFGMEPSDVRWVRERAQAIRAALAVTP